MFFSHPRLWVTVFRKEEIPLSPRFDARVKKGKDKSLNYAALDYKTHPTKPGRFLTTLFVSHKRDKIIKECHQQQSDLLPCKGIRYTAASTTFPFPVNNLFIPIKHSKNRACIKREEKPLKEFSFLFSALL